MKRAGVFLVKASYWLALAALLMALDDFVTWCAMSVKHWPLVVVALTFIAALLSGAAGRMLLHSHKHHTHP